MNTRPVTDVLNELLQEELGNLAQRLLESTAFVSRRAVADLEVVRKLARDSRDFCGRLAGLIHELGGTPWPRRALMRAADLHFCELRHALPALENHLAELIDRYARAAAEVANEPRAAALIHLIRERHGAHLHALRSRHRAESPPTTLTTA